MEMVTRESKARLILELGIQRKSILELTKKKKTVVYVKHENCICDSRLINRFNLKKCTRKRSCTFKAIDRELFLPAP